MAKFIFLYRGPATDMDDMTEEQSKEVMAKWQAWMGGVGDALQVIGSPCGPRASVVDDGSGGTAADMNGYTIVEADNLDAAKALTENHPFLSEGSGRFAIDVYELMPVPM